MSKCRSGRLVAFSLILLLSSVTFAAESAQVWWSSEKDPKDGDWYKNPQPIQYHLSQQPDLPITETRDIDGTKVEVNPSVRYQTMLGIGTSLEESTIYNLSRMSPEKRTEVLKGLLTAEGADMSLIRICFGSSDFTGRRWYSYDDMPAGKTDPSLKNFSIKKDVEYRIISTLKEAQKLNPDLKFFASPWSPPGWMKDSGTMIGGHLLPRYYAAAAKYYRMAIQAYQKLGIPIYAFTLQNEPGVNSTYPSTEFSWQQERDFVKAVKAEFENAGLKTKIWILDHNFDMAMNYAGEILKDTAAYEATDGIAFHHYVGKPDEMSTLKEAYPKKDIFFTEGSLWGISGMDRMIRYFRNWASSYNAWVTMLDSNRKPNNGPFQTDSTLAIQSTRDENQYWWTPEFYLTAQFSRFVRPGAKRIESTYGSTSTITTVAFADSDGTIVLVAANQTEKSQTFRISIHGGGQIVATLPAKTLGTYRWTSEN